MKYLHSTRTLGFISQLAFALTLTAGQDIYFDLSNTTGTADYLLGTRLVENASYASSSLSLSSILSDNSRAYLDLSHSQIFPNDEYSSTQGELGLQLRYLEIKDNQFFAGLHGYLNHYQETYSYYNSSGFGLYLKWKYYFKANQLLTTGYDLSTKKYDEVAEASNSEHNLFIAYNQSFKTKTSVKLNTSIAIQDFWAQYSLSGRGRNMNTSEVSDIPTNSLLTTEIRVSQSLGSKIGLTLWLESQTLLNDIVGALDVQDGLDNPFTDRFRWEGPSSSLRLIYRLNQNNHFQISHSYLDKNYLAVPAYLFDFQTMDYSLDEDEELIDLGYDRADERNNIQLQWTKFWMSTHSDWLSDISVVVGAGWTQNRSNDPLYDYDSMNYSIGLNFNN